MGLKQKRQNTCNSLWFKEDGVFRGYKGRRNLSSSDSFVNYLCFILSPLSLISLYPTTRNERFFAKPRKPTNRAEAYTFIRRTTGEEG